MLELISLSADIDEAFQATPDFTFAVIPAFAMWTVPSKAYS